MLQQLQLVLSFLSFLIEKDFEKRLKYADDAPELGDSAAQAQELGSLDL
jgi:hypothetical protein